MVNCCCCMKSITSKHAKLECTDCKGEFHGSCYKMSKADVDCILADGMPWRCEPCAKTRRKSLRFDSDVQEGKLTLEDIMKKILEFTENQRQQEVNFNRSHEALAEKIDDNNRIIKEQGNSMEKYMKLIEEIMQQNKALTKRVTELEQRLDEMEQYSRVNAVEIHGVPEQNNEDVISVVKEVGKALDMDISDSMIDACHRLGRRTGPNSPPPGIIVKFVRRLDKEEILRKRRVKRTLSTRHMNLPMDQPVYINEALTPTRRRLLAEARKIKRDKGLKFLWVRGGKIFLRREEKAPVIQVTCQADLNKL